MGVYRVIKKLARDDQGATMVEYAIMIGFIAAACVGAVIALGPSVSGLFVIPWP
jgi:Flp pilus assembly pilin Flp